VSHRFLISVLVCFLLFCLSSALAQTRDTRQLTHEPEWAIHPHWSPDGTTIAYEASHGGARNVWTVPVEGGESTQRTSLPIQAMRPSWSPDGTRIAFTHAGDIWTILVGEWRPHENHFPRPRRPLPVLVTRRHRSGLRVRP